MRNQISEKKRRELTRKTALAVLSLFIFAAFHTSAVWAYQTETLYGEGFTHADKAYSYFAQGKYAETERELQAALGYYPGHPRLLLLLVQSLEQRGNYAEALKQIAEINEKNPDFAQALAIRAYIHAKMANHAEAVVYFKRTLESADGENVDRQSIRINLIDSALRSHEPAIAAEYLQEQDPQTLRLQIARNLIDSKMYDTALKVLDGVSISSLPALTAAEVLYLRASVLEKTGRNTEATAAYNEVLALIEPGGSPYLKSEVLWKFSEAAERKGDIPSALKLGRDSVNAWPESTARRLQFAYMAKRHKQEKIAAEQFEYAVLHSKESVPVSVVRDLAYTLKRLGENAKAMKYFERSIDAAEKPETLPAAQRQKAIELNYDLRREHETLERKWGMYDSPHILEPCRRRCSFAGKR